MQRKILKYGLPLLFWCWHITAQTGIPISFLYPQTINSALRQNLSAVMLSSPDNQNLRTQSSAAGNQPNTYGFELSEVMNLKTSAQYYNPSINNGKLWILKVESQTALGLQFKFNQFDLPMNSSLNIYNDELNQILGPFGGGSNIDPSSEPYVSTLPIMDNIVYLEYFESNDSPYSGNLQIEKVTHVFSNPYSTASASCHEDVDCVIGMTPQRKSVALVLATDINGWAKFGTGVLLNDASSSGTGYFLTSGSYLKDVTFPSNTIKFVFDWEMAICGNNGTIPMNVNLTNKHTSGATRLLTDNYDAADFAQKSDYCFLKLNATSQQFASLGVCFSGWNNNWQAPSNNYYLLHHPGQDIKKITRGSGLNTQATSYPSTIANSYVLTGANYYDFTVSNGGAPESGSEGSPLFNSNNEVVATFSKIKDLTSNSTMDLCSPSTYDLYFGSFYKHWVNGLSTYLDPNGSTFGSVMYNCPVVYTPPSLQNFNQGIIINGKSDWVARICATNNLVITPAIASKFRLQDYEKQISCGDSRYDENNSAKYCHSTGLFSNKKCYCDFINYALYIQELDYNNNPIGPVYVKHCETVRESSVNNEPSQININISNDFPGLTLTPGKYYTFTIGSSVSHWDYENRIIYIIPNNLSIGGQTVTSDLYAMNNISLSNASVSTPISVVAANQIEILPQTNLSAGSYFINPINCNSFFKIASNSPGRSTEANPPELTSAPLNQNGHVYHSVANRNTTSIFPNPTSGLFSVSMQSLELFSVTVYDLVGKILLSKKNIQFESELNLSTFANGIYYVKIETCTKSEIKKVIKQ
jgi:hypothetical protein